MKSWQHALPWKASGLSSCICINMQSQSHQCHLQDLSDRIQKPNDISQDYFQLKQTMFSFPFCLCVQLDCTNLFYFCLPVIWNTTFKLLAIFKNPNLFLVWLALVAWMSPCLNLGQCLTINKEGVFLIPPFFTVCIFGLFGCKARSLPLHFDVSLTGIFLFK